MKQFRSLATTRKCQQHQPEITWIFIYFVSNIKPGIDSQIKEREYIFNIEYAYAYAYIAKRILCYYEIFYFSLQGKKKSETRPIYKSRSWLNKKVSRNEDKIIL